MGKLRVEATRTLLLCVVLLVLPAIASAQPTPPGERLYSPELKIMLTVIFIFIGSTAFYTSSLICGHNIYRDFNYSISVFLTSIVGFLLFIFSPISFIVLSPDLFMKEKANDIHAIISKIHSLIYDFALWPFLLSSTGVGMIFGSFTLIRARKILLRWFRDISGLHYVIYTYQFTWDRFLCSIKRHGKVRLLLKNEGKSPEGREPEGTLQGELIYFSAKEEPKEIII